MVEKLFGKWSCGVIIWLIFVVLLGVIGGMFIDLGFCGEFIRWFGFLVVYRG